MGTTNLELVDRYIAAVKFWLPAHLREDVGAELAEDIRSEIEEAERAKGRPLTDDEVAAILKARGNPLLVAGRYMPQRHLIGPEIFPVYIFVLKIVAVICIVLPLVAWFAKAIFNPLPLSFNAPFDSLLMAFAVVTIVFALIEYKGIDIAKKTDWNPQALRPVVDRNRIARSDSIGEIIGSLIGIGFFAAGYLSITTYHFPTGGSITVAPEWIAFWQTIIAIALVEIALASVNLFKPYWSGLRVVAWLAISLAKTAAFCWLVQSHVVREIGGVPDHVARQFLLVSDKAAEFALPFFGFVAAITIATALWRLVRTFKPRAAIA
jgi:hypothetical protein